MSSPGGYSSDDDSRKGTPNRVFKDPEYPIVIVDQKYCSNYPITLTFEKNGAVEDKFKISDEDGNVLFRAQKKKGGRRVMMDESNEPVISFTSKAISSLFINMSWHCIDHITMHRRRQAYRGDSHDQRIFSVKKTRGFKSLRYDVYMTSNMTESTFNYRVYDSYRDGSSVIYAGDKATKLAQLNIQVTHQKTVKKEEKFTVDLSPNVDKAFVSALLIIREEVRKSRYKGYES
ncbi:hypothetical protein OSB04_020159 [Centaurea solstitialis]|uniref:Tubby C-terminal-like domain-containing protein n=1 Tax=Centaurea solstitialis TaxID=347529 RepID=A0AA38T347_9ASTR|nr:hypothetical protein OSB04_020159 [Centaurea solstitialis]